ncbi:MAG: M23 family metallopeptidase [Candidatus Gracilibacteria bacterium]|nr:M23 family metallopeptidase [Candidatus Gracilibacteria bacterium]
MFKYSQWLSGTVTFIWICNCLLASMIAVREIWIPYMDAGGDSYTKITSDPFDGTTMPIAYVPDWTKTENQDKSKRFEDISISDYVSIPLYNQLALLNDIENTSKASTILHYTYTVPYMGSYSLNYKENDGSHLGVDIRAPIGTPVLSMANGVVIRTVEADATGNKFIVVRHDNVPLNGVNQTLYSSYLHLSEILIPEGTKVKKGDMIGRVGMTGIATTPHLHFQIDNTNAPFHPYWPFTTSDSQKAGLSFYESVNAGLGKENALKYTINPMNFVNTYLGGLQQDTFSSAPTQTSTSTSSTSTAQSNSPQTVIASYVSTNLEACSQKRYNDVSTKSTLGKMLYTLIDDKCLFQGYGGNFSAKTTVTKKEALVAIMKYYGIQPSNGTSPFLDIAIGDNFQGYAVIAYQRGIIEGNYAYPDKIITKGEFIDLLVKVARPTKNTSGIAIFRDINSTNIYYQSAQDYGYMIHVNGGKLYPNTLMTRSNLVQILYRLQ